MATYLSRIVSLVATVVLARILSPQDFGLINIALIVTASIGVFLEFGFKDALIYRKDAEEASYTAFFVNILNGSALFALMLLASPMIAGFFGEPKAVGIIRALSVNFVILAIGVAPGALLEKQMRFRERAIPDVLSTVVYGVVSISLAALRFGAWSLVAGELARSAVLSIGALWVCRWRPRMRFDPAEARGLFNYGRHVVFASLLVLLNSNIDNIFVGKAFGAEVLGAYAMAFRLSQMSVSEVAAIIRRVVFPAFCEVQLQTEIASGAFLKLFRYVGLLAFPITAFMVCFPGELIRGVLGSKWEMAVGPLIPLAFYGLMRGLAGLAGSVILSSGKSYIPPRIMLIQMAVSLVLIWPLAAAWGSVGVAVAVTAGYLASFVLHIRAAVGILDMKWQKPIAQLRDAAAACVISSIVTWPLRSVSLSASWRLAALAVVFSAAYFLAAHVLARGRLVPDAVALFRR